MPAPSPSSTITGDARSPKPAYRASASTGSDTPGPRSRICAASPIKVVSQRIGHADPAVTMQVYAHALDGDDATAAELTAAAIFGDRYR
jgi:integrase